MSSEDLFKPIAEQAVSELQTEVRRLPKDFTLLIHKEFEPRIRLLLPFNSRASNSYQSIFKKVKYVGSLEPSQEEGTVLSIVPNDAVFVKQLCNDFKKIPKYRKRMLIIPRYGAFAQKVVEESGLESQIEVEEFHYDLLPLEPYEFLVPVPHCFRKVFIDGDIDDLTSIAKALVKSEILNGVFPSVVTFGTYAERVNHILGEMKAQIGVGAFGAQSAFHSLIIIDRTADLFTPLITQFTYGGTLDDMSNPPCGILSLPDEVPFQNREILINDADEVFRNIRGLRFSEAVDYVNAQLQEIESVQKNLKAGMETSLFKANAEKGKHLSDMKPYLSLHLAMMEYLSTKKTSDEIFKPAIDFELQNLMGLEIDPVFMEDQLIEDKSWTEALRLYCLESVFHRGLASSTLLSVRKRYINKFGFDFLYDIDNLERVGLLRPQAGFFSFSSRGPSWEKVKDTFQLMVDPNSKEDVGSFHEGYVPLSARLVQAAMKGELPGAKKRVLTNMKIPVVTDVRSNISTSSKKSDFDTTTTKKVLVFVIGGMTPSEISVIREMGKTIYHGAVEFYIGTTSIISGRRLLQEVCPKLAELEGGSLPVPDKPKMSHSTPAPQPDAPKK